MFVRRSHVKCHGASTIFHRNLSLAYTLHKPTSIERKPQNEPIVILHGLFGSKQNNRSISKCGYLATSTIVVYLTNSIRALARSLDRAVYAVVGADCARLLPKYLLTGAGSPKSWRLAARSGSYLSINGR